jgi:hypothetical protein
MKTPVRAVAAVVGIGVFIFVLAMACREARGGTPTREVLVPQKGMVLAVGDVVFVDSAAERVVRVPPKYIRDEMTAGTELFLVAAAHGVSYSVTRVTPFPEASVVEHNATACWRECLAAPAAVGLRVGDIVFLDDATGSMVPVPVGYLKAELDAGTELLLVNETLGASYSVNRMGPSSRGVEPVGRSSPDVPKRQSGKAAGRAGAVPDQTTEAVRQPAQVAFVR